MRGQFPENREKKTRAEGRVPRQMGRTVSGVVPGALVPECHRSQFVAPALVCAVLALKSSIFRRFTAQSLGGIRGLGIGLGVPLLFD
jgi:hypothetical protein